MNSDAINVWLKRFKKDIVPIGLNDDLIKAFLNHLADLKIFNIKHAEIWELNDSSKDWNENTCRHLIKRLNALCETEMGFAVGYFLKAKSDYVSPGLPDELESSESDTVLSKDRPLISKSSDLSNLQIVKKVGRQLSPFLEMEKKYIARLEGPQTSKKDAQKMYQYIFGKTFQKSTPLPWQQLSRRRHK